MKIASEQQEKLQQAKDRCKYRLQGADPHGAYPTGIVRSSYWKFYSGEEELPVYDTPVTHGGPQSFVVIPWGFYSRITGSGMGRRDSAGKFTYCCNSGEPQNSFC